MTTFSSSLKFLWLISMESIPQNHYCVHNFKSCHAHKQGKAASGVLRSCWKVDRSKSQNEVLLALHAGQFGLGGWELKQLTNAITSGLTITKLKWLLLYKLWANYSQRTMVKVEDGPVVYIWLNIIIHSNEL